MVDFTIYVNKHYSWNIDFFYLFFINVYEAYNLVSWISQLKYSFFFTNGDNYDSLYNEVIGYEFGV